MTEERKHANLLATVILTARRLQPLLEEDDAEGKPNMGREYWVETLILRGIWHGHFRPTTVILQSLIAFRPRTSRRRPRGAGVVGFPRHAPVDFDRTFEVRAVFDHDLCRRQIPDHRTVLPDLDSTFRAHVPLHVAVHHHVAGVDVSR